MPRPTPIPTRLPAPHLPRPSGSPTKAEKTLRQIIRSSFIKVNRERQASEVSTEWLPILVLESLRKYAQSPDTFGRTRRSFDRATHEYFNYLYSYPAWKAQLDALQDKYEPLRQSIENKIGTDKIPKYLSKTGSNDIFMDCADKMISNGLISRGVPLPTGSTSSEIECRRIVAGLSEIHCINPEEIRNDEPYFFTGTTLFDATGNLDSPKTQDSKVARGIGAGDNVPLLPEAIAMLFTKDLIKPSEAISVSPVTLLCSVSLMEHEHGNTERIYQAFKAGYQTAKLLMAFAGGTTGGPIGIAIAVVGILISLAIALDGDDQLGDVIFRFDDVLGGDECSTLPFEKIIDGSHWGNRYKYKITINYRSIDFTCPSLPDLSVSGPGTRTIRWEGEGTEGGYGLNYDGQVEEIVWKADALELADPELPTHNTAFIPQNGERYARVHFRLPGTYKVSVTALDPTRGETLSGSKNVDVKFEEQPQWEAPIHVP